MAKVFANNLNSCFSATYNRLWIADITLEPRSKRATVVPTAAPWFPSPTCMSAMDANLCPAVTTIPINCSNVAEGSLYGKNTNASFRLPPGVSTSLNSPGCIGEASSLTLTPLCLNPAGKFDNVPASNN